MKFIVPELLICLVFSVAGYWVELRLAGGAPGDATHSRAATSSEPVESYQQAREADRAYAAKDWGRAASLLAQVTRTNPQRGEYRYRLGLAHYHQGDFDRAIPAFARSAELGQYPAASTYNIAACYSRSGRADDAFRFIARALELKWDNRRAFAEDDDFAALKGDPRLERYAGLPKGRPGRDEAWRLDLDFLAGELKRLHIDLYHRITPTELAERIRRLHEQIPTLKDHEIVAGLLRLLAAIGDGHTLMFWPTSGPHAFHALPVRFYSFEEGYFITAGDTDHREFIGDKLVCVGDTPVEEAARRLSEYISHDNEYGIRRYIGTALGYPELLYASRIIDRPDEVHLEVETREGKRRKLTLRPTAATPEVESVLTPAPVETGEIPLRFKNPTLPYWLELLPEHRALYVQYRVCGNRKGETFASFCQRVFDLIDKNSVDKLIVDLRNNEGGSNLVNKYLVQGILRTPKINRKGRLFVLVGRHTFSAAMCCAADLERWADALFAGEPTGSSPNFIGDTSRVILPYSELRASISTHIWQNSVAFDQRAWIAPQFFAKPKFTDWVSGRDPALDAALTYSE